MASKSIHLVIQTETVIVQEQAGSQARKSMDKVADPQQRPSIICQTPFSLKTCPEPGVKQHLGPILALQIQCLAQDFYR